jgi:hypothetical protein
MSSKVPPYAKNFKNHRVIIFHDDNTITHYPVYNIDAGTIETSEHMLPLADAVKVYDKTHGGFTFLYNCPTPALVEAENLKSLRRSVAIKNIFTYDREKGIDFMKVLPYLIAIAAIVFGH